MMRGAEKASRLSHAELLPSEGCIYKSLSFSLLFFTPTDPHFTDVKLKSRRIPHGVALGPRLKEYVWASGVHIITGIG